MSGQEELKDLMDSISSGFSEFKSQHQKSVQNIQKRLDELELSGQRDNGSYGRQSEEQEKYRNAFYSYVIKGIDALSTDVRNELSVGSDPDGGFAVPSETSRKLIQKVFETSPVRQLCNIEMIAADRLEILQDNHEIESGWVGEVESRAETGTPELGVLTIPLFEQYAMPAATQRFLDCASDALALGRIENWLTRKIAEKLARAENLGFVGGDGIKKPRGFLTYSTSDVADDTRPWGTVQFVKTGVSGGFAPKGSGPADVIIRLIFSLKPEYLRNAVFVANRLTLAQLFLLKDEQDRSLLQPAKISNRSQFEIFGFPVYVFDNMPNISANSLSLAFGDFERAYTIIDHIRGLRILRDPLTTKGRVKFYSSKLCGGDLTNSEAIKLLKFSA